MANPSTLLTQAIAASGDKNTIPSTTSTLGAMSQAYGFPAECSLPLGQGGVAPSRKDFNGAFNLLSLYALMAQRGGVWQYISTQNYEVPAFVQDASDSCYYICVAANGPSGTTIAPHSDTTSTYWKKILDANGKAITAATADNADSLTGLTATVAELNTLDGITATTTELNYCDGVTSNIQTQLNSKLNGSGLTASSVMVTDSSGAATTGMTTTELNAKINATQGAIIIAGSPDYYSRSALPTVTQTTVVMPSRLWVNVNDTGYIKSAAETLDLTAAASWDSTTTNYTTAANRAGKDFYIYACNDSGSLKYLLSANSTVPTGYTADTSRKIGGFHCLCVSVGTISGHTLSGYVAGDILPLSIWDLKHRPVSDPEGMVYVTGLGLWVDIYLASLSNGKLVSAYGGVVADGGSSTKFHGYRFDEYFGLIGKRTLWQREFEVASQGSNQCTNIYGSSDPNTTGGHKDTASRRMISNYGLEDCCGAYWQWGCDSAEYTPGGTWTSPNKYFANYAYKDIIYDSSIESSQGQSYGIPRRALFGGRWDFAAYCGSRCSAWASVPSYLTTAFGSRGASEPWAAA